MGDSVSCVFPLAPHAPRSVPAARLGEEEGRPPRPPPSAPTPPAAPRRSRGGCGRAKRPAPALGAQLRRPPPGERARAAAAIEPEDPPAAKAAAGGKALGGTHGRRSKACGCPMPGASCTGCHLVLVSVAHGVPPLRQELAKNQGRGACQTRVRSSLGVAYGTQCMLKHAPYVLWALL